MSQDKVATRADVHVTQISRIENGRSGVKMDTLERIVNAINSLSVTGHQINLEAAFNEAGFTRAGNSSEILDIADGVRVSMLHGKELSEDERRRFEMAFKIAYEQAKQIIEEEKE